MDKDTDIRITLDELRIVKKALQNYRISLYANKRLRWNDLSVMEARKYDRDIKLCEALLKEVTNNIKLLDVTENHS